MPIAQFDIILALDEIQRSISHRCLLTLQAWITNMDFQPTAAFEAPILQKTVRTDKVTVPVGSCENSDIS
jgi:hypothetical protein